MNDMNTVTINPHFNKIVERFKGYPHLHDSMREHTDIFFHSDRDDEGRNAMHRFEDTTRDALGAVGEALDAFQNLTPKERGQIRLQSVLGGAAGVFETAAKLVMKAAEETKEAAAKITEIKSLEDEDTKRSALGLPRLANALNQFSHVIRQCSPAGFAIRHELHQQRERQKATQEYLSNQTSQIISNQVPETAA